MLLTLEQVRAVTLGALDICYDEEGILRFARMTPTQAEAFARCNPDFAHKTSATAGIRLDFFTDARSIRIRYGGVKPGSSRLFYYFDLYVNGILTMHSGSRNLFHDPEGELYTELAPGTKRIQLFFPGLVNAGLRFVELSAGASITPVPPKERILCLGDSITQGYDAAFSSCSYVNHIARALDAEVVNQAVGGAMFHPAPLAYAGAFDRITVAYGTNDWNKKDHETLFSDADQFLEKLRRLYPDVPAYLILPIWRNDLNRITAAGAFSTFRRELGELGASHHMKIIDAIDFVPHDPMLYRDGYLHPNDAGFYPYAMHLLNVLKS